MSDRRSRGIYLDNHATTALDPMVLETMMPYLTGAFGNAASTTHRYGLEAARAVELARDSVAALINAKSKEIVFTSGATESNNLVLKGFFERCPKEKRELITSNAEHKCVLESASWLSQQGVKITIIPVLSDGRPDISAIIQAIGPGTGLVSIMVANNETGAIADLQRLGAACRDRGVPLHTDAAQGLGKIPINVEKLGIDFLSGSAHKFYGPKGMGFLYVRRSRGIHPLEPQMLGGGHEWGLRSGTPNVPGIVGLGAAASLARIEMHKNLRHLLVLRRTLWLGLKEIFGEAMLLNGPFDAVMEDAQESTLDDAAVETLASNLTRLPNNINISVVGIDRDLFFKSLKDVALSSGSACASGDLKASYVLKALGRDDVLAQNSLRMGVGRFNTLEELVPALRLIGEAYLSSKRT